MSFEMKNTFRHCCGIVAKVCKSKAKTTVLMKCSTGQIFVVTAFATVVGKYGVFVELCQEGSVSLTIRSFIFRFRSSI